jgi:hypothetical protein
VDIGNGDQLWRVEHDDGDTADYTRHETRKPMMTCGALPSTIVRNNNNNTATSHAGRTVAKWCHGRRCKGVVESVDTDEANGQHVWTVKCEDEDHADYYIDELESMVTPQS